MLEVYSQDRASRYGYVADPQKGVMPLAADKARNLTNAGKLVCASPKCRSKLIFVAPSPIRRAHWRHADAEASSCDITSGRQAEGEWHLRVKNEFFGNGAEFEVFLSTQRGDARADVLVNSKIGRVAVEVQHSNISYADAKERMLRHRQFGLRGTIWMIDAEAANVHAEDLKWLTNNAEQYPKSNGRARGSLSSRRDQSGNYGDPTLPDKGGVLIQYSSHAAILELCAEMTEEGYPCTPLLVAERSDGELIARRPLEGQSRDSQKRSGFVVRAFSTTLIRREPMRRWAEGKTSQTRLLTGLRRSGDRINSSIYLFGLTSIRVRSFANPGGYRWKGGFVTENGMTCDCFECEKRIRDGLDSLHIDKTISAPTAKALDYLENRLSDPWHLRHMNIMHGGRAASIWLPEKHLWSLPGIDPDYALWLERMDERLRSLGWPGHYYSNAREVRDLNYAA